jgi:general secretion pathway protein L
MALEAPRLAGGECLIPLQPESPAQARRERRISVALAGLCLCLALTAAASPFVQQALAEAELDARIAALQPRVAEVEALRRRVQAEAASGDAIGQEYAAIGDPLAAIAVLTTLLPDDTFLQELSLAQRKLGLRGQSASASRLIAALAADPAIRNPAFAAPVVRVESGQRDVFSIRAEWGAR